MPNETSSQPLKVFLCHASSDKPTVRRLYTYLRENGFEPWLDEENLLPGQDWQIEIPKAVRAADAVVICLSKSSINKEGYVQKEISFALNIAEEKPENRIYLIPARLEVCEVPSRLSRWQWVDLFSNNGGKKLLEALNLRGKTINTSPPAPKVDLVNPYGDADPIPPISTDEVSSSNATSKTPSGLEMSLEEKEKLAGEFHRVAIPIVGALAGFGATLSFRALSGEYSGDSYSVTALAADTVASSDFLFLALGLVSAVVGAGGAYALNEYYQSQKIPIWFRYLSVILLFYVIGWLLDLVSCFVLPAIVFIGVGIIAAYIYKETR